MADDKERIELELAIKSAGLEALQKINVNISEILRGINELGKVGGATSESGVARSIQSVKVLTQETKEAAKSFDFMTNILLPMAGPAGRIAAVAVAVAGAGMAMQRFAGNALQRKLMLEDVGLSEEVGSQLQRVFEKQGLSSERAYERVLQIGEQLQKLETGGTQSDVYLKLQGRGFQEIGDTMLRLKQAHQEEKIVPAFIEYYEKLQNEDQRRADIFLETAQLISKSEMENFRELLKKTGPAVRLNTKALKEFNQTFNEIGRFFGDHWNMLMDWLNVVSLGAMKRAAEPGPMRWYDPFLGALVGREGAPQQPSGAPGPGQPTNRIPFMNLPKTFPEDKDPQVEKEIQDTKKESTETLGKIRDWFRERFAPAKPKWVGGNIYAGQNYLVGERGPELMTGAGGQELVGQRGPQIVRPRSMGEIIPLPRRRPESDLAPIDPRMFPSPSITTGEDMLDTRGQLRNFMEKGAPFPDLGGYQEWQNAPGRSWTYRGGGGDLPEPGEIMKEIEGHGLRLREGSPFKDIPDAEQWSMQDRWKKRPEDISLRSDSERNRIELNDALREDSGGASLGARINFKNVPSDVTTKVDGEGFDDFTVSKSKALEEAT